MSRIETGTVLNFAYTGAAQEITLPKGTYRLECWGAQGGDANATYAFGGRGGYASGIITLNQKKEVFIYVGQSGPVPSAVGISKPAFNGGGYGNTNSTTTTFRVSSGGGASDIRIGTDSLFARVIVAGAGGGSGYSGSSQHANGGVGGGETGGDGKPFSAYTRHGYGGTQTEGGKNGNNTSDNYGSFGQGGSDVTASLAGAGGGGGWYGGGASDGYYCGGGGGSGFVWTGLNAPDGYLLTEEHFLTETQNIAGDTAFAAPDGTEETGHSGNGYARITVLETFLNAPDNFRISASAYNTVTLSWDAVDGATGYKLYRDGNQIATVTDQSYIDSVNPFMCYDYSIIAFNDDGESDRATLSFTFMPDNPIPYLITDRTQQDVNRARELAGKLNAGTATVEELAEWNSIALKGCYDYTDLNRVSAVVQYLDDMLKGHGYIAGVSGKQLGRLPAGYTELEYIESSGTQYVDSGFKPNNNSRVVLDFEPTAAYSSIVGIFGTRDENSGTAANMFVFWNNGANTFRTDYFGTQQTMTVSTLLARQTVDKDKNVTTIGSVSASNAASTGQCSNNLYLFCTNDAGTENYFAKLKLYSCQIYDNGTLVRDFVPCVNASGEAGLYDLVGEKFYGNSGTGAFAVGPETGKSGSSPNVWTEHNAFTPAYAENYLTNIDRLWSVLTLYETTPKVPDDTENLTVEEANAIEQILVDLESTIKTMLKTRVACGDAYCGGEYL